MQSVVGRIRLLRDLRRRGVVPRPRTVYSSAAFMTVLALIPVLPALPHQHLIELPGVRLNVVLGGALLAVAMFGIISRRAGAWWVAVGLLATATATGTTGSGASIGVVTMLPLVALSVLIIAAACGTLRGTIASAYGVVLGLASSVTSWFVLRAGAYPDADIGIALCVVAVTAILMVAVRRRQHPPSGSIIELTAAREKYGVTQMSACSNAGAKTAIVLPGGGYVPANVLLSVAVIGGDPLVPEHDVTRSIADVGRVCSDFGLIPCVFQSHSRLHAAYRAAGFRLVKFGEEAIVDLADFDIRKSRYANVRHELRRAQRRFLTARVIDVGDIDAFLWENLRRVSDAWQGDRAALGFSMRTLEDLRAGEGTISVVANDIGTVVAFSSWHRVGNGLALDLMRRAPHAPPGAMDLCIAAALEWARDAGCDHASLGSVPFRDGAGDISTNRIATWLRRALFHSEVAGYRYVSLAHFKGKFTTRWETRHIAVRGGTPGLALALAAITAAHYRTPVVAQPVRPTHLPGTPAAQSAVAAGQHGRRESVNRILPGLVTLALAAFATLLFAPLIENWLLSEGTYPDIAIGLGLSFALIPAAAAAAFGGVRRLVVICTTMSVFAVIAIPATIHRALIVVPPPQIAVSQNPGGWAEAFAAALLICAITTVLGVFIGAELRRILPPAIRAAVTSRRVALLVALTVLAVVAGASYTPAFLSEGPAAMMETYAASSSIPRGDIGQLFVAGRKVLVYTPALRRTNASVKLPVVYLLHGQPGAATDWLTSGVDGPGILDQLISSGAIPPMIAVMPDASDDHNAAGEWSNSAIGQQNESWIVDDLVPAVSAQFHPLARPACSGIAGYSEGGFAAMSLALRHPGTFGWAVSLSGYYDANASVFGPATKANSPTSLARQLAPADRIPIFLGAGSGDPFLAPTQQFADELQGLGWKPATLVVESGGHSVLTWRPLMAKAFTWIGRQWDVPGAAGSPTACNPEF